MLVSAYDEIGMHHLLEQRFKAFNPVKPPRRADNLSHCGARRPKLAEQSRAEQCLGAGVREIIFRTNRAAEAGEILLQPVKRSRVGLGAIRLGKDRSQTSGKVRQR